MRRVLFVLLVGLLGLGGAVVVGPPRAAAEEPLGGGLRVGVAVRDATWHVGAAAGQYSDIRNPFDELQGGDVDPYAHATTKENSYGVASRLTIRAIVVEGANGVRTALVKSDNYLAQDHLLRRVGQLLEAAGSGVAYGDILHAATHNHSSPYYATPSWGVWVFEDVVDLRMFEYQARVMADAILAAEADLAPARMGATVVQHDLFKGNIMRPQTADDGSPAGFPNDHGDRDLTVLRFDRLTDAGPEPLALWMNWGQHPESLDAYDLITADYLGPLERMVDRETDATLVFSQGDVGSAEGPYEGWNRGRRADGTLVAWAHVGHAQMERGARLLADAVVDAYERIGRGEGVGWRDDAEVTVVDGWIPGPISHPYPSVSNCRTGPTVSGEPGLPVAGLPDCAREGGTESFSPVWENLKAHGIPVPEHYDAPALGAVEENARLRLQVVAIGDVLLGSCACEAQVDLIRNFKSRANDVVGDVEVGFDWADDAHTTCAPVDGGDWHCVYDDPDAHGHREWTFSAGAYARWRAQLHNPADGWMALAYAPYANAEPDDPAEIKGNFTTEELDADTGFRLVVGVGHAGDYNGYTVSYREYMAYDHYRKALTSYGPHTADWMVTWLVRMARSIHDPAYDWQAELDATDPSAAAREGTDEARQVATSTLLGELSGAAYDAWQTTLPDDVGPAVVLTQPRDVQRFEAATTTWRGGSNAVDNPVATVERLVDGVWTPYADMSGEVQTWVELPDGVAGLADSHTGSQPWIWHANFEAYTGGPDPSLGATPPGTYRFAIAGHVRRDGSTTPYALTSEPFEVAVWDGLPTPSLALEDGEVVVTVPRVLYPRTYDATHPYVADDGRGRLVDADGAPLPDDLRVCHTCSFRPWAFEGRVAAVDVTVTRRNGRSEVHALSPDGPDRWTAELRLRPGDVVTVPAGGVRDAAGNVNATPAEPVEVLPPGKAHAAGTVGVAPPPATAGGSVGLGPATPDTTLAATPAGDLPARRLVVLVGLLAVVALVAALRLGPTRP